jgi:tRNA1Val (adenine37-N6)-methyltransferase
MFTFHEKYSNFQTLKLQTIFVLCSLFFALDSWFLTLGSVIDMPNNYFQFKQFTVYHDRCSMKVSTDGVLLGAWADVNNISHALDVGTGSGLIALMIAQRSAALIDAVEIDHPACTQAFENVERSPWKNRIHVHSDSFQHFASVCGKKYDLIVSNPPYFRDALKPGDKRRSKARHDTDLTFDELLSNTSFLLNDNGRFCAILPYPEQENFIGLAYIHRLYCHRIVFIKTIAAADFSRIMLSFSHMPSVKAEKEELVIHRENGLYSYDYIRITKEFYLGF